MLPNPLASRWGRLMAFFFLYVTEGIPLGFTATTMAVQMKRAGVTEAQIGVFVGSLFLPWAWKWVAGPFVDLIYSNRLGPRRGWILGTQIMMVLTLLACMPIELSAENLSLITMVIMVHNTFCATQDVAIDALACNVLHENERGLANGLMFAGQQMGVPLGGACVLYLIQGIDISWLPALRNGIPVQSAYWFVIGCITLVTLLVVLPMREEPRRRPPHDGTPLEAAKDELRAYVRTALKSFFGNRTGFFALVFALLPAGAMGLSLALQKTAAVDVGFSDSDVANLEIASSVTFAVMCVLGGLVSDRLGHLKCLAVFLALMSLPTFWCAYRMQTEGAVFPQRMTAAAGTGAAATTDGGEDASKDPPAKQASVFAGDETPAVATSFWWAVVVYAAFAGLMFGTRMAVFMRIANPDVAATQFTAYMAMMNLVTAYTAFWQGYTIEHYGYPITLAIDGVLGLVGITLLPLLREQKSDSEAAEVEAQ